VKVLPPSATEMLVAHHSSISDVKRIISSCDGNFRWTWIWMSIRPALNAFEPKMVCLLV
jgi:hypothetical protein